MRTTLLVHIVAGGLSLLFGYVALYAAKGRALHRGSGTLFVYLMLVMSLLGALIALVRGVEPAVNVPAGVVTAYLVITGLTTIRPPAAGARWLAVGAMLTAFATGMTCLVFGFEAVANGGTRHGMPAFPFFLFGTIGVLASAGDARLLLRGPLRGSRRLARHLWRMSFALLIAALSFFIGQADEFPQPIRIMPLLALPVLAVLATMLYWLWRVRVGRVLQEFGGGGAPDPAGTTGHAAASSVSALDVRLGSRLVPPAGEPPGVHPPAIGAAPALHEHALAAPRGRDQ